MGSSPSAGRKHRNHDNQGNQNKKIKKHDENIRDYIMTIMKKDDETEIKELGYLPFFGYQQISTFKNGLRNGWTYYYNPQSNSILGKTMFKNDREDQFSYNDNILEFKILTFYRGKWSDTRHYDKEGLIRFAQYWDRNGHQKIVEPPSRWTLVRRVIRRFDQCAARQKKNRQVILYEKLKDIVPLPKDLWYIVIQMLNIYDLRQTIIHIPDSM